MEPDTRPFAAVNVGMTRAQTRDERYPWDGPRAPAVADFRCNLTALSQRYNLYFIAWHQYIAVYQPEFPFQKLRKWPALLITPSLTEPRARGYIGSHRYGVSPHSVNHLVVSEMGSAEVLAVATDSGNVAAYYTKAICDAIEKEPYRYSPRGLSDLVGLRAFFSHWVYESAWGLAMHKEGRMLAVSSNKPYHIQRGSDSATITVFAFALTAAENETKSDDSCSDPTHEDDEGEEWIEWDPAELHGWAPRRDRNYKIELGGENGHASNIPSVSFVNSKDDPDGCWLLSTDIHGDTKYWQIWTASCRQSWEFQDHATQNWDHMFRIDGGWTIAALDPASFRPAKTMDEFCGHRRAPPYPGGGVPSFNLTNIVRLSVPGNCVRHPRLDSEPDENDYQDGAEQVAEEYSDDEPEGPATPSYRLATGLGPRLPPMQDILAEKLSNQASDQVPPPQSDHHQDIPLTRVVLGPGAAGLERDVQGLILDNAEDNTNETLEEEPHADVEDEAQSTDFAPNALPQFVQDHALSDSADTDESEFSGLEEEHEEAEVASLLLTSPETSGPDSPTAVPKPQLASSKRPRAGPKPKLANPPEVPVMLCSLSHVRLLNAPRARFPHVYCANILTQELDWQIEQAFGSLARLSMVQYVPELGLLFIASQLGRCAVCTLTRNTEGIFGFRVDHILPTRSQERAGWRPKESPLLGMAVGPIQGHEHGNPEAGDDEDNCWGKEDDEREPLYVEGIRTSFDPSILPLRATDDPDTSEEELDTMPARKRSRRQPKSSASTHRKGDSSARSSSSSIASTQQLPWARPRATEEWEAVESSRRYRLMMTYTDLTVLTYEMSRSVERDEVR